MRVKLHRQLFICFPSLSFLDSMPCRFGAENELKTIRSSLSMAQPNSNYLFDYIKCNSELSEKRLLLNGNRNIHLAHRAISLSSISNTYLMNLQHRFAPVTANYMQNAHCTYEHIKRHYIKLLESFS